MDDFYKIPWLDCGDFNDHAESSSEKTSFSARSDARNTAKSRDNINKCSRLIDLGCSRPRSNGGGGTVNTLVRLDRALANSDWRLKFPDSGKLTSYVLRPLPHDCKHGR